MPESLPGSTTALREELEAATATFEDEQAAHQETLSLLAAANAKADDSAQKLAAMEKYHEFAVTQSQEALAAARRECDLLTSSVMYLRLAGAQMADFIAEQMPLFGGTSTEFDGEGEPRELLKLWRKADKLADKSYGPALAAPASASGEEERIEADFERLRDVPTMPPDFEDRE